MEPVALDHRLELRGERALAESEGREVSPGLEVVSLPSGERDAYQMDTESERYKLVEDRLTDARGIDENPQGIGLRTAHRHGSESLGKPPHQLRVGEVQRETFEVADKVVGCGP